MIGSRAIVAFLLVTAAPLLEGRSIDKRQLGNLGSIQCNVARLKIVGSLASTRRSVNDIQDAATKDAATAGLDQAKDGISQIAQAILAGETAPEDGRDQVEAGLTAVGDALAAGDASDPAVAEAQEGLDDSVKAGQDVVADC